MRLTETRGLRLPDEPQEGRNRSWAVEQFSATLSVVHYKYKHVSRYLEYRSNWNMRRPGAAHSVAWKHHKREIQLGSRWVSRKNQIDMQMSVFLENSAIWVQVEHKVDGNSGTAPTWWAPRRAKPVVGCRRVFSNLMSSPLRMRSICFCFILTSIQ